MGVVNVSTPGVDSSLRQRAVAGDDEAFVALIAPLVEPALRVAYSMLGDRMEAEDLVVPGQKPTVVGRVGTFAPAHQNAGGPYVVACSVERDRAVVVQSGGQGVGVARFWVMQLSTGRVMWQGGSGVSLAASRDAQYVAVNQIGRTSVVYGPSGAVAARLDTWIHAFSWDGASAVTSASSTGSPVVLIRWRDGSVLWSGPSDDGHSFWTSLPEPGGTRIAIGILDPAYPQTTGFAPVDLFVVSGDGSVILRKDNVYPYF